MGHERKIAFMKAAIEQTNVTQKAGPYCTMIQPPPPSIQPVGYEGGGYL